jgi:phosphoribosylformylglycinamidine cyclo-ligase
MSLSNKDAGVDIAAADGFVGRIARLAKATHAGRVVEHESKYAGLITPGTDGMREPLLAATCDGVGTKLLVAKAVGRYDGLGQDLVAMSVNDLMPLAARPVLFLDYIAVGKLDPAAMETVVGSIARACSEVGCALLGGETAEMPGLYAAGDFDLAGFAVGVVDRQKLPQPEAMREGDVVLGLPSTGVHSNGYSLARAALLERGKLQLTDEPKALGGRTLADVLLTPTGLYVRPVLRLLERHTFRAAAHVTGGGLLGRGKKLARPGLRLVLDPRTWSVPPIFDLIREAGGVAPAEMASTFNMGLGFLVVMGADEGASVARELAADGWRVVGRVERGAPGVELGFARADFEP